MKKEVDLKNKIYIIGSVASGKSTFAKKLAQMKCIPLYEQDNIVHHENKKRSEYERDEIFHHIIRQKSWIIEGVYHDYFIDGLKKADTIILLDPPCLLVKWRILTRWIKQKLKLANCAYTPSFRILFLMFKWNREYNEKKEEIIELLNQYDNQLMIVKNANILLLKH